jgi:hypothetical protein
MTKPKPKRPTRWTGDEIMVVARIATNLTAHRDVTDMGWEGEAMLFSDDQGRAVFSLTKTSRKQFVARHARRTLYRGDSVEGMESAILDEICPAPDLSAWTAEEQTELHRLWAVLRPWGTSMTTWTDDEGDHFVNFDDRHDGALYTVMKASFPSRVYSDRVGIAYTFDVFDRSDNMHVLYSGDSIKDAVEAGGSLRVAPCMAAAA